MEYKDFIKPGEKVIHVPPYNVYFDCFLGDPQVVTIGKYPPYYTDDTPDPTPDEYEACCRVEIEGATTYDETQPQLATLLPIIKAEKPTEKLYNNKLYEVYGKDEDGEYVVLINEDGVDYDPELMVVDASDVEEHAEWSFLTTDELKKLRSEIVLNSVYLSDYHNSVGLTIDEAMTLGYTYLEWLPCDKDKVDWSKDTPENFADFVQNHY